MRIGGACLILAFVFCAQTEASVAKLVGARPTGPSHSTSWIIFNERTRCNAVLISETILVTAGHCLGGIHAGDYASSVQKLSETNATNTLRIRNTFTFPNPYPMPANGDYRFYSQDVGFLVLESPTRISPIALDLDRQPEPNDRGTAVSYGGPAAERTVGTMRLRRIQNDAWVYGGSASTDVIGEPGDSGSAVLSREDRGIPIKIASCGVARKPALILIPPSRIPCISQRFY